MEQERFSTPFTGTILVKDRPEPGAWSPQSGYEKSGEWEDGYAVVREEYILS